MTQSELEQQLGSAEELASHGRYEDALATLQTTMARAAAEGLTGLQATAMCHRAKISRIMGDTNQAGRAVQQALRLYDSVGDGTGRAQALLVQSEIFSDEARLAEMEEVSREAIALSEAASAPLVLARGQTLLGTALIYQGRGEEAKAEIDRATAAYRSAEDQRGVATSLLTAGRIDHMQGRVSAAIPQITEALGIFHGLGDRRAMAAACVALGQMRLERGEVEQAKVYARQGIELNDGTGERGMLLRSMLLMAQAEVEAGEWEPARDRLLAAVELCRVPDQQGILPELCRTLAQAYLGGQAVEEARRYTELSIANASTEDAYSLGTANIVLGLVLVAEAKLEDAIQTFRRGVSYLEVADEAYELGWGTFLLGQAELAQGDSGRAARHFREARAYYEALGATSRVALIDQFLSQNA